MATNSKSSAYIEQIDKSFPIAGQDNDSQGFRDNYSNIYQALSLTDQELADLKLNAVVLNDTNNFGDNLIEQAQLKNCSLFIFDNTQNTLAGDITLNCSNGNYQKYKVGPGLSNISVANWPAEGQATFIILSVTTDTIQGASLKFSAPSLINLGPEILPLNLTGPTQQFFQLWSDGISGNMYVKGMGGPATLSMAELIAAAQTNIAAVTSLTLGGTNVYTTSTNPNTAFATVVTANGKVGNIALLPNQIRLVATGAAVTDVVSNTTAFTFPVQTTVGLVNGASLNFPYSVGSFTVTSFTINTVTVTPAFAVGAFSIGDPIVCFNPQFNNQPTLVTIRADTVTSTAAAVGDQKGQISASAAGLLVSYADYQYGANTWVKISADKVNQTTQLLSDKSSKLATTEFCSNLIHSILPYGSITLWSGTISNIPTGWALCNGANSTPDLRDRFVVGAGNSYAVYGTGGSADSSLPSHSHTASSTVSDPGHNHGTAWGESSGLSAGKYGLVVDSSGNTVTNQVGSGRTDSDNNENLSSTSATGVTVSTSISSTGSAAYGSNLPPYFALCYIMKTSGSWIALNLVSTESPAVMVADIGAYQLVGQPYYQTNTVSGGTGPYTFTVSTAGGASSGLPAGTSLNTANGTVSGTPTTAGYYTYTVTATDSTSPTRLAASQTISGSIYNAWG